MKKIFTLFFFIVCISFSGLAQTFKQYQKAGNKAFYQGEYFAAISYLEKAKAFHQKNDEIFYTIGLSYFELKDYKNALKNFDQIKAKNNLVKVFYEMGLCFMHIGDYKNAISNFETFKNNYRVKDFMAEDAEQKLASCFWATEHLELEKDILVKSIGVNVNTEFSEFSPSFFKDDLLQITSFFQDEADKRNDYISDILFFEKINTDWTKIDFKFPSKKNRQIANGFYLAEKERFYFTQCEQSNARCDLYVSQYENNAWSTPIYLNINDPKFTSTQPFVYVNKAGKDVLFYVSDSYESIGGTDIFGAVESRYGIFDKNFFIDPRINTKGAEASPYYDKENKILYFSSDFHYGYGGFDIFKLDLKKDNTKVKNLGLPYNSSANDLYFKAYEPGKYFFSSNRKAAMKLKAEACCYDVFTTEKDEKQIIARQDSMAALKRLIAVNQKDSIKKILTEIEKMLPVRVYFHNDEPMPKTTDTLTNLSYEDAYNSFIQVKDTYYIQNRFNEIDNFFYDNLEAGFSNLKTFENLLSALIKDYKIKLELSGYASPLAENDYNINLSKRRISSIQNYFSKNEKLRKALASGQLIIVEIPYGEEKADRSISDHYFDPKNSIFSVKAALSRKVSIVGILIE